MIFSGLRLDKQGEGGMLVFGWLEPCKTVGASATNKLGVPRYKGRVAANNRTQEREIACKSTSTEVSTPSRFQNYPNRGLIHPGAGKHYRRPYEGEGRAGR